MDFFRGGTAAAGAGLALIPEWLKGLVWTILLFILLDTVTGLVAAAKQKQVSSGKFRERLAIKLLCYVAIVGLFFGVTILTSNLIAVGAGMGLVLSAEVLSIVENVLILDYAGARLPHFLRVALRRIETFFVFSAEKAVNQVLPAEEPEEGKRE